MAKKELSQGNQASKSDHKVKAYPIFIAFKQNKTALHPVLTLTFCLTDFVFLALFIVVRQGQGKTIHLYPVKVYYLLPAASCFRFHSDILMYSEFSNKYEYYQLPMKYGLWQGHQTKKKSHSSFPSSLWIFNVFIFLLACGLISSRIITSPLVVGVSALAEFWAPAGTEERVLLMRNGNQIWKAFNHQNHDTGS